MIKRLAISLLLFFAAPLLAADLSPQPYVQLQHPEWVKSATIYEVNIRQFTPEGTFKAFETHLPRLKALGVDILWLMPIHPIGEKNRKGTLGSYYSVRDYFGVNPEFGSADDLRHLIDQAHAMGMYVILDWVANHSAWDNPLVEQHPDWYLKSRYGNFQSTPWRDYDDIIDFDYSAVGLRAYMVEAMKYWVEAFDVDGFRCDVASFVPVDFWEDARQELDAVKPVFMLAEAADRDLHQRAFDMTYAWQFWDHLHHIATKGSGLGALTGGYIAEHVSIWPQDAIRMNMVTNHDKNSWEGTLADFFGPAIDAAIVLSNTFEGMPMIYSGQEAGFDRQLKFFDKDLIEWRDHPKRALYQTLFHLKHKNQALWNGQWGGRVERIRHDKLDQVVAFARHKNGDKVISIVNYSGTPVSVVLDTQFDQGEYYNVFTEQPVLIGHSTTLQLPAWGYQVLETSNRRSGY